MEVLDFETLAITGGYDPFECETRDVSPSITTTTTYAQDAPGSFPRFDYSRHGNHTRAVLEKSLAQVENAKYSLVFSSGCAAVTNVLHLFKSGDHFISVNDLYGGIGRIFLQLATKMNISTTFIENTDTEGFKTAIQPNTKLIWLETPSNPQLKICDVKKIANDAHGANPEIIVAVDNTFLTPYFQRPLELGADMSMMSLSKYMNGHHDIIMGSLTVNSKDLYGKLYFLQKTIGATPSPTDCYQVYRGIKTLPLRMEKHQKNSLEVAGWLEKHPKVERVIHPLLKSHPQLELTKKQAKGHSGMISLFVVGPVKNTVKFLTSLKMIHIATSLGGCSTTIAVPTLMIPMIHDYAEEPEDLRSVDDKLIRLSIGLEKVDDIIKDIDQALKNV